MRLNRGGLIASAIYTLHFAIFFSWSLFAALKPSVFFASIAVFPAVLFWAGIGILFRTNNFPFPVDSWLNTIPAYYVESLVILYFVGWAASARTAISKVSRDTR